MTRVQITLTGDLADQFMARKDRLEGELGHEIPRTTAFSMMMYDGDDSSIPMSKTTR